MSAQEIRAECAIEKWLPILVMRPKNEPGTVVPVFDSAYVAHKFAKRNLPSNWLCGTVVLRRRDAEWMDDKGWRAKKLDYPRKLTNVVDFDIEILEYEPEYEMVMQL
jgi:hypothetical protein